MITKRRRSFSLAAMISALALAVGVGQPLAAQAADGASGKMTTIAVVTVANYDRMIGDINFLGGLGGNPQAGQMVEGFFAFFTQNKGPAAIDKTQPWGVIVQTDGEEFVVIGCLPVTQPDDLLDVAVAFGAQVHEAEEGVKQLVLPNEQTLYVKQEGEWTFIGDSTRALERLPENPRGILADLAADYNVAATLSVKDVPEEWRQVLLSAMEAGMQQGMVRGAGESDEQFEMRRRIAEGQVEQWKRMLNDTDAITIGWAIDAQQKRTYLDFTQVFVPGSKMAQQVEAYGQPRTNFAGFFQPDAAGTMVFATSVDPELMREDIEYLESMMHVTRQQVNKAIDEHPEIAATPEARTALKAAASDFIDAFEATIRAGQFDGGAALQLSPDSLTLVAGALVKEPGKIESGLRHLETAAQHEAAGLERVDWNAASHGGVNFHTLKVPVPQDEQRVRQVLGSELSIAVGIGPEAVYLAVGKDNLDAVKRAIDASAAEPNKAVPPFELSISLGPILDVVAAHADEGDERAVVKTMATTIRNEAPGRDRIRMVGQLIPNGLRYRMEAEEGVLRAMGKAVTEAQRRAMQAHQ